MDPSTDPGVTAPPAEPAAPAAPASPDPNGSEPVINPGNPGEQQVPFSRFQEVNDKAKANEDEANRLREENEQLRNQSTTSQGDDDLDPDVEEMIRKGAKKLGLVSKDELDAQALQTQVRQDVAELSQNPPVPGIPFDDQAVREYANKNNLPIISKAAWVAAYREMNRDKIEEAIRNKAVDDFKNGSTGAEKPGPTGATPPTEPEVTGNSPRERIKSRIGLARQKHNV